MNTLSLITVSTLGGSRLKHLRNLGRVALAAYLAGLPGAFILQHQLAAPFWYKALASLVAAVAFALIALVVGAVVLIAARNKADSGRKAATICAVVTSLYCSFSAIYPMLRQ